MRLVILHSRAVLALFIMSGPALIFAPADFGVKTAAAAAFGEIPRLFDVAFAVFVTGERGVKDGESTLRKRFELHVFSHN